MDRGRRRGIHVREQTIPLGLAGYGPGFGVLAGLCGLVHLKLHPVWELVVDRSAGKVRIDARIVGGRVWSRDAFDLSQVDSVELASESHTVLMGGNVKTEGPNYRFYVPMIVLRGGRKVRTTLGGDPGFQTASRRKSTLAKTLGVRAM